MLADNPTRFSVVSAADRIAFNEQRPVMHGAVCVKPVCRHHPLSVRVYSSPEYFIVASVL
jgi:hypothetical protein